MPLESLAKYGAMASCAGVVLMVAFAVVLLAFPVIKNCDEHVKCFYQSTAPMQLQSIVQPSVLAISLMSISSGLLMLRFSRWRESKKAEEEK